MRQYTALFWKEWQEDRAYLFIGLGIFLGLPAIAGLERYGPLRPFEIDASPWVLIFGGTLAIFIAAGGTSRDLNSRLQDFWQSMPVGVVPWMTIKYLVGVSIVMLCCILPLVAELCFNRNKDAVLILIWYPCFWAALYSTGFLAGVLLRRPAHAATLGLAGMLLIYCLPLVFPPLTWMNAQTVLDAVPPIRQRPKLWENSYAKFDAGMLVLTLVLLGMGMIAARQKWKIDSSRKLLYGCISTAIVLIFASAGFQLGTNLPVLQQINLPPREVVQQIQFANGKGFVVTRSELRGLVNYHLRTLTVKKAGVELGEPRHIAEQNWHRPYAASTAEHPELLYTTVITGEGPHGSEPWFAISIVNTETNVQTNGPRLWRQKKYDLTRVVDDPPWVFASGNRLCCLYGATMDVSVLDISNPLQPILLSIQPPPNYGLEYRDNEDPPHFKVQLADFAGLNFHERLKMAFYWGWSDVFDSSTGTLCRATFVNEDTDLTLSLYRSHKLNDHTASFKKCGTFQQPFLSKFFGITENYYPQIFNGLIYKSERSGAYLNRSISIIDTRGPNTMKVIGHFAAPDVSMVCPLADGRALVGGGGTIWLVGPPPH